MRRLPASWIGGCLALIGAGPAAGQIAEVPVFGLGAFERNAPVSITADVLDAQERDGRRVLSFRRNVRVRQGDLRLRTGRLEAVYRDGAQEPERLSARGGARVQEGSRRAECDEVVYQREARTLVCRGGPARLWDGEDHISGEVFHFDLADHRVEVSGGTRLEIHRSWLPELEGESEGEEPDLEIEALRGEGPVTVESRELEARDDDGARTIRFAGDVVVHRGELSLRSDELVLAFPAGAQQPERLVAEGSVVVRDAAREAQCARAEYRPGLRTVDCQGGARLREGDDRLESEALHLDLGAQRVDATGRATLWLDLGRRGPS